MLSVHDLPGLYSIGHLMTLVFMALGMAAAVYGFLGERRREKEEREASKVGATVLNPPPAPAFMAPNAASSRETAPSIEAADSRGTTSLRSEPAKSAPRSEEEGPHPQADLANALLEHLEAQGYEFDPGPALGR